MEQAVENGLGKSASAYLRSARFQPVQWMEWGAEAFAKAKAEGKPVLLDIGAVWCHWCHVMDRESYENELTAKMINDLFVAVKVDRDERPDVDTRYQSAVAAISGGGGWPLTAFLTPEGKPYFGGTYFPPEDRYGRPSFQRVLLTMAEAFQNKPEDVEETASSVMEAIEQSETFAGGGGALSGALVEKMIAAMVAQHDARHGGFGSQPKFPHSGAIDLLIDAAGRGDARAGEVVRSTLTKMAAGGVHDQLAGGFHRYSVDERWIVPHFEKMAYDNSELLKNYAHAYAVFGDEEFARVARGIVRWMDECLSDRELGGFYASQDADVSLEDDGDYFTWTRAEAEAVLEREEFFVAEAYYNLRAVGDMHHNPQKNVLHVVAAVEGIGKALALDVERVRELVESATAKLCAARLRRKAPYVDRTIYSGWNAMCVSGYLAAARALGDEGVKAFALRSLDRGLAAWQVEAGLAHVVAYGEGVAATGRVPGVLEDYAFVANAALDGWEATGEVKYFVAAQEIADAMLARFFDDVGGGFFDTERVAGALGALSARRKPLQDSPTPAGNATAATVLLRLAALTHDGVYEARARETLETFAGIVEHFGLYAASYGLALRSAVAGMEQVYVVGEGAVAEEMYREACVGFAVNRSVVRLKQVEDLPAVLALSSLPGPGDGVAVVCRGRVCLPVVTTVEALRVVLGRV